MGQETLQEKLLKQFFYHPMKPFHVRELSRIAHVDAKTVMKYLRTWQQQGLVRRVHPIGRFVYYESQRTGRAYHYEKSQMIVKHIIYSGLIDYLEEHLHPKALVLFGSMQKGTYHLQSDIDIYAQAQQIHIDLHRFEQKLGHSVNLFFEPKPKKLSKGLLTNIYNGYILAGNLEVIS